ncbi:MAG: NYN domain-containing protein [Candidatus Pacebacteria bacterium]|nr:NYN domain-containing protein [Candidatus Paceibacterota bacterium]
MSEEATHIPDISEAAADWLAQTPSDQEVYDMLRETVFAEDIFSGQKMTVASAGRKIVRRRLKTALRRSPEVRALFLAADETPWAAWARCIAMFDEDWLKTHWRQLIRAVGNGNLIVALALDDRPSLRQRGKRLLLRTEFWDPSRQPWQNSPATPPPDWQTLTALLHCHKPSRDTTDRHDDTKDKLQRQAGALQKEVEKLHRALNKQKEKNDTLQDRHTKALTAHADEKQQLRQQLRRFQQQNEHLRSDVQEQVEARMNEFRRAVLGVTPAVQRMQEALRSRETDSLMERARITLDAHRKLNEKYGTVTDLEDEIRSLQATLDDITECLAQSVKVLPEIYDVRADILERLGELQGLVPQSRDLPKRELARRIHRMIDEASLENQGTDTLQALGKDMDEGPLSSLLTDKEKTDIGDALQEKEAKLRALKKAALLATSAPEKPHHAPNIPMAIWDVNQALEQLPSGSKPWLFVDGYNVVKRIPELNKLSQQVSLAQARQALCELCQAQTRHFERMEIVFDGKGALSNREALGDLTIVFSAELAESQNADNYIVQRTKGIQSEADIVWLVTADRGLQQRASLYADGFMSPADFYLFLKQGPNHDHLRH